MEGVRGLKAQDGPDLILSGSCSLTSVVLEHGLADEMLLLVYPVLLGKGKRLFAEGTHRAAFALRARKLRRRASSSTTIRRREVCRI